MYGALIMFEDEFIHIVAISFSALVLTELIMVALTIRTWHHIMMLAEIFSLALYLLSLVVLKDYFGKSGASMRTKRLNLEYICLVDIHGLLSFNADAEFIKTTDFLWKVLVITLVSCMPLYILKFLRKKFSPPSYTKLS